jgi:hypothetical protein
MRINKNTNHTKRNLAVMSVLLLLLLGSVGVWYFMHNSNAQELRENVVDYKPATKEQEVAGLDAKNSFNEKYYGNSTSGETDTDPKKDVGVLISSANQDSNILTIATSIETLEGGTCELKLSRDGSNTITRQVNVIKITTYSACEDFNIDVTDLIKGEWTARVNYLGSSAIGTTSTKVNIK